MSRPPRPPLRSSLSGNAMAQSMLPRQPVDAGDFGYLSLGFAELLDLQTRIGREEAAMVLTGGPVDAAKSLMEAAALLGHILAQYQNLYAREAFLTTARFASSLVRHARRLAYVPDAGLAATGDLVMQIGEGLRGRLPEGFAVASTPFGEQKAQTYELLSDLDVNAAWNEIHPAAAEIPTAITFAADGTAVIPLVGRSLNLAIGAYVLLEGQGRLVPLRIEAFAEDPARNETAATVRAMPAAPMPALAPYDAAQGGYRLRIEPASEFRIFGWQADPVRFPTSDLGKPQAYIAPNLTLSSPTAGQPGLTSVSSSHTTMTRSPPTVGRRGLTSVSSSHTAPKQTSPAAGRPGYSGVSALGSQLFLASAAEAPLVGQPVAIVEESALAAYDVVAEESIKLAFIRADIVEFSVPTSITPAAGSTSTTTITYRTEKRAVETSVSASVTALTLKSPGTISNHSWTSFPVRARALTNWRRALAVVPTRLNPAPATQPLPVVGALEGMRPGRSLLLANRAATRHQVVQLTRLAVTSERSGEISWLPETPGWTLGDLRILGNIARISHGETVETVLGGSDGVTPFQRFTVKKSPVTQVPGAAGGTLALEIRVDGVVWHRVDDFRKSGADDRVYRIETDAHGLATVIFGDGRNGAIPHAGRQSIVARYRVGLGTDGNVEGGRVVRVKKASPILDRVFNPLPVSGGAPPAAEDDIRTQCTRFIRTFERAVSVSDYADLALLFPGVARASARSVADGVEVVVATAEGVAPEALAALRAFLDARRDRSLRLVLAGPQAVDVDLAITIAFDPDVLPEIVKAAAQEALYGSEEGASAGLFAFAARSFGQPAHLSQVYAAVTAVAHVISVAVTRFDLAGANQGATVRDIIRAAPRQWLRLKPQNCDITMVAAAAAGTTTVGGGG
jgi:predicted phage baseplate assembly protein